MMWIEIHNEIEITSWPRSTMPNPNQCVGNLLEQGLL